MSLLLTLNIFHVCSSATIVNFEQTNADWVINASPLTLSRSSDLNNNKIVKQSLALKF